jgi:hypothetical protein
LETPQGDVVGSIGNIPMAYEFRGKQLRAAAGCDWVVDPPFRKLSMQLMQQFTKQDADLLFHTTVSPSAELTCKFMGFSKMPVGQWNRAAFWVTNYRGFSQSALRRKAIPLTGVLSYPASLALYCRDTFNGSASDDLSRRANIEMCAQFDNRFDVFYAELREQFAETVLAVRTRAALEWHFGSALSHNRCWAVTSLQNNRITAAAIFDQQDNSSVGLRRVRLVDFQALRGFEHEIHPILAFMLKKCRQDHVHILEVLGCWLDRPGMPPVRVPYLRTLPSWAYYYKATNRELAKELQQRGVWVPSSFDGDASL